jgi:hypothetical protein
VGHEITMKELKHFLWVALILAIFSSPKMVDKVKDFLVWYITINFEESPLSIIGQILCRGLSLVLSYLAVGALFKGIGWFNSGAMRIAYFFVSLFVSMVLSYIIMVFEKHMILISCLLMGITLVTITVLLVWKYRSQGKAEQ